MSETFQIILGFFILMVVFLLTRWGTVMKIQSTCRSVIKDLENRGAFGPDTAVALPYDRSHPFKIGVRDYRPKALESLIQSNIVIKTNGGRYYLANR